MNEICAFLKIEEKTKISLKENNTRYKYLSIEEIKLLADISIKRIWWIHKKIE